MGLSTLQCLPLPETLQLKPMLRTHKTDACIAVDLIFYSVLTNTYIIYSLNHCRHQFRTLQLPSVRFKGYNPLIVVRPLLFQILNEAGDFPVQLHHHSGDKRKYIQFKKELKVAFILKFYKLNIQE